jgi:hypothetical protein
MVVGNIRAGALPGWIALPGAGDRRLLRRLEEMCPAISFGGRLETGRRPEGDCEGLMVSFKLDTLTGLGTAIEPIRSHFNARRDRVRFLALLSPT